MRTTLVTGQMKLQRLLQLHLNNVAGIGIARLHADALMPNHNIDEGYLDCLAKDTSHVINALAHQMTACSSRDSMPNFARSGLKVIDVQLSDDLQLVILGSLFLLMLLLKTCGIRLCDLIQLACMHSEHMIMCAPEQPACIYGLSAHHMSRQ